VRDDLYRLSEQLGWTSWWGACKSLITVTTIAVLVRFAEPAHGWNSVNDEVFGAVLLWVLGVSALFWLHKDSFAG
jgi:hypothetical protein